ncbi:ComF family protein [Saccharopolyspora phatthalungensis]|uniref:Putative amidophosphoribosyltransferase n=1 Tax=Saccharopolyspora phatthalungensis TaxID=664693 RepID=A0A840Q647_9PSEU|nr:ComF family protein [Saccharopolyspora phatthalungensis]MBB5155171.1 putative amidophosphoribosyltransferase [Saccharopolyspora phatthalungensis]
MRASWLDDGLSGLIDLLLPLRCAGCDAPGTAWCRACSAGLGGLRRVERPLLAEPAPPVYALGAYRGPARRAVLAYKESGRRNLAAPLARHLAVGLRAITAEHRLGRAWWLVPAPSRRIASRRRGGAHMSRIAHRVAAELTRAGWPTSVADCLVTARGAVDSAGLDAAERVSNLSGRVLARTGRFPPPTAQVALIDDVITTAATVASCLEVLGTAGVGVAAVLSLTATAG